jgi:hypothetical protein
LQRELQVARKQALQQHKRMIFEKRAKESIREEFAESAGEMSALTAHVGKLMELLRLEVTSKTQLEEEVAFARADAEAALRSKAELAAAHSAHSKLVEEVRRGSESLQKQLELMDARNIATTKTLQFERARNRKIERLSKEKLHACGVILQDKAVLLADASAARAHVLAGFLGFLKDVYTCQEVAVIDLEDCALGNAGAVALGQLLRSLPLLLDPSNDSCPQVSPNVAVVSAMRQLIHERRYTHSQRPLPKLCLKLGFNAIGDEGAEALAKAITSFTKIMRVDLRGNSILPTGLEMILAALQYNTNVLSVDLSGNLIGNSDLATYLENVNVKVTLLPELTLVSDGEFNRRSRAREVPKQSSARHDRPRSADGRLEPWQVHNFMAQEMQGKRQECRTQIENALKTPIDTLRGSVLPTPLRMDCSDLDMSWRDGSFGWDCNSFRRLGSEVFSQQPLLQHRSPLCRVSLQIALHIVNHTVCFVGCVCDLRLLCWP